MHFVMMDPSARTLNLSDGRCRIHSSRTDGILSRLKQVSANRTTTRARERWSIGNAFSEDLSDIFIKNRRDQFAVHVRYQRSSHAHHHRPSPELNHDNIQPWETCNASKDEGRISYAEHLTLLTTSQLWDNWSREAQVTQRSREEY